MALFFQSFEVPALLAGFVGICWAYYFGMNPEAGPRLRATAREWAAAAHAVAGTRVTAALDAAATAVVRIQLPTMLTADALFVAPEPAADESPTVRIRFTDSGPVIVPMSATHHHRHHGQTKFRDWLTEANSKHFAGMNEFNELRDRVERHAKALRRSSVHTALLRDLTVISTAEADARYPKLAALR
jgi:hypothetical protein